MTIHARFLPKYPKRIDVTDGLTKREANGVLTLGFDYVNSEFGAELQQAVASTAADAVSTAADRSAAEAAKTAAETAQGLAEGYASEAAGTIAAFSTYEDAVASSLDIAPDRLDTKGYHAIGRGGALYKNNGTTTGDLVITLSDGTTHAGYDLVSDPVNQYMFGAKGNGTDDDTTAIKAMVTFAEAKGFEIKALPGLHKITDTIALLKSADLSACVFYAEATVVSPVVRFGVTSGAGAFSQTFRLPKVVNASKYNVDATKLIGFSKSVTGWTGIDDKIGVEGGTCNNCYVYLEDIYGFGVGFTGGGYTNDGFAYNRVFPKYLLNNKANFRLKPGNDTGWSNENTVFGGRYDFDTDEGTGVDNVYDIFLTADPTCENVANNNLFIHPSVESNAPAYCIWFLGKYNKVISPRFDGAKKFVGIYSRTAGESSYNEIQGGYGTVSSTTLGVDFYGERSYGNAIVGAGFANLEGATYQPGIATTNIAGDGQNYPHIVGYPTGVTTIDKRDVSTADGVKYAYILQAQGLLGKRAADTGGRAALDWYNGLVKVGDGAGNYASLGYSSPGAFTIDSSIYPTSDGGQQFGWSSGRIKDIFLVNAPTVTSDIREKLWRGALKAAEERVALRLVPLIGVYQMLSAVSEKGDKARLHVGLSAQAVKAAFEAEGLNGFDYGLLCYDEWDAREGVARGGEIVVAAIEAGNRYGLRYTELYAFVLGGVLSRHQAQMEAIESRITALEGR